MNPTVKKTLIASSVALTLGASVAHAALVTNLFGPYNFSTDRANFTMLSRWWRYRRRHQRCDHDVGRQRLHRQLGLHRPGQRGQRHGLVHHGVLRLHLDGA